MPCFLHVLHHWCRPFAVFSAQTPHTEVSGFVDDWPMACHGLPAISAVSNLIHDFEQASGQQINRGKSALIPARQLSEDAKASCVALWNCDIRISSRERVVFIGIHVSIHDQYCNAVHKFDMALCVFSRVKISLSLAMRVLVMNIFMFTLFSQVIFHAVFCCKRLSGKFCVSQSQSHGPNWECSRQLAHCVVHFYFCKIYDFPMSLVCCLLTKPGVTFVMARSLHWDDGDDDTFLPNPAISWKVAFDFFRHTVGTTHPEILSETAQRRP